MYLDIHAHFAEEGYDVKEELSRMKGAGVEKVVLSSDTVLHSQMHALLAKEHAPVYFTAGIHPSNACEYGEKTDGELIPLLSMPKCIAVGEIGLDYHYPDTDKPAQYKAFCAQLALADRENLPVQIHSRDACADTLSVLREHQSLLKRGFLLHCYSYSPESLEDFLSLGAFFSFGGVTTFKNAKKAVESVAACPIERILTETDSPYLSPFRGQKNTPANIPVILARIAEIKGVDVEEMKEQVKKNAYALFPKLI